MADLQLIPARHATATFVPAGQVIKIVNTSGTQVIDTWAFALPKPDPKPEGQQQDQGQVDEEQQAKKTSKQRASQPTASKTSKKPADLPSQEEAEKATQQARAEEGDAQPAQSSTWASYVPTKIWPLSKGDASKESSAETETEQQKNSRTWSSYFPSGKGISNYIPGTAKNTVSGFASLASGALHKRDPNKSYMEQLQDFSRTPVGAAGWGGLAALTGSGWGGSTFAGYQAWNAQNAANAAPMEYMSMQHTRAATLHLRPKVDDTFISNFREPLLTLIEDSSSGIHDTLIPACDPARYKGLGVENWEEHGSCAENLVLALEELNKRAGLKGAKGVGADLTINSVPAPLNLFMNIPWDEAGDIDFAKPQCKKNDFVRLKAERDVVVVMSACPQDITDVNNKEPTDAHFIVEGEEDAAPAIKRTQQTRKRPPPRKISSSHATSTQGTETGAPASQRPPAPQRKTVAQKQQPTAAPTPAAKPASTHAPKKKPVPPPVAPQKRAANPTGGAGQAKPGPAPATAPATGEKKKPRKLNAKSSTAT